MKVFQKWCKLSLILLCLTVLTACQGAFEPSAAPDGGGAAEEVLSLADPAVPASSSPSLPGSETEPAASPAGESGPELPPEDPAAGENTGGQPETAAPVQSETPAEVPEQEPAPAANSTLYVLMYHSFAPEGTECNDWTVTDARFREDLQWLASNGYTMLLPSELAAGGPLPDKAVMLTFDDGYVNNYTIAYPILQEFQAKAVISLIVTNQFHASPTHLSWEMCREMVQSGLVEIGSHTYNCHNESPSGIQRMEGETREEYEARVLTDLQTSISLIEENVGTAVQFFAYPYGLKESWASDFLKEHFSATVTTCHGSTDISKGLYDMNRCNVTMDVPLSSLLAAK